MVCDHESKRDILTHPAVERTKKGAEDDGEKPGAGLEGLERSVPKTLEPEQDGSVRCDGGMKLLCALIDGDSLMSGQERLLMSKEDWLLVRGSQGLIIKRALVEQPGLDRFPDVFDHFSHLRTKRDKGRL